MKSYYLQSGFSLTLLCCLAVLASVTGCAGMATATAAPGKTPGGPLVVANYFLSFTGGATPVGEPYLYTPGHLDHAVGQWHDAARQDYWLAGRGESGFLSYGPYDYEMGIERKMGDVNGTTYGALVIRFDYELMTDDNAFGNQPLGTVDILATVVNTETRRVLYSRDIYPQDFLQAGEFQKFSFTMADYVPLFTEKLEFRVQTNGTRALALRGILATPCAFDPVYGGWSNVPWQGGLDLGSSYRLFNPDWLLTSHFLKNGGVEPLESIDDWRRDIWVGHAGLYPYVGPYDQRDPEVLRYQIRQAKAAGINGFKVYVYYQGGCGDGGLATWDWRWAAFDSMLDIAAEEGFGLFIDDSKLEQIAQGYDYSLDDAVCNLGYAAREGYLDHPGYLKIDGRPLYGLPVTNESDPGAIAQFMARLNGAYHAESDNPADLYTLVTAMTTWGVPNPRGPYNLQEVFIDQAYHMYTDWADYFICDPPPVSFGDLLARGRCKYDPEKPVSGYGVFLATLLERPSMAGFRNMPGVTSLFDWCGVGSMTYPQSLRPVGGHYVFGGQADTTTTAEAFARYVDDAHRYGYTAVVTISPGHDKSNAWKDVDYQIIPMHEADGKTLRWRRMVQSALDAGPDILAIENWNGYGEAVHIEPCNGFHNDVTGEEDPDIMLRILAESLGGEYIAPPIPRLIVDPVKRRSIPAMRYESDPNNAIALTQWVQYQ